MYARTQLTWCPAHPITCKTHAYTDTDTDEGYGHRHAENDNPYKDTYRGICHIHVHASSPATGVYAVYSRTHF